MKKIVISDVHGNIEALEECLFNAGVINAFGKRKTDENSRCEVWSIGDLANCVEDEIHDDLACLQQVGFWIDYLLMGNHELPYFGGNTAFYGWFYHQRVYEELKRIEGENRLRSHALIGPYLITHAGWDKDTHPYISTPQEAAECLRDRLQNEGWESRYFSAIGKARGGFAKHGGILWEDFNAIRSPFPQIVGHTVEDTIRAKENIICIDTGGGKYGKPTAITIS